MAMKIETTMRKMTRPWIAFPLTEAPHDGPMNEADTSFAPTPNCVSRADLAASCLSPAASVSTRTELPPMTVATTLPGMPAWLIAASAFCS